MGHMCYGGQEGRKWWKLINTREEKTITLHGETDKAGKKWLEEQREEIEAGEKRGRNNMVMPNLWNVMKQITKEDLYGNIFQI